MIRQVFNKPLLRALTPATRSVRFCSTEQVESEEVKSPESPLKGTETLANLKKLFHLQAAASHRYAFLAKQADYQGDVQFSQMYRSLANGKTAIAERIMEMIIVNNGLDVMCDADYMGPTIDNLYASNEVEKLQAEEIIPRISETAHNESMEEAVELMQSIELTSDRHLDLIEDELDILEEQNKEAMSGKETMDGPQA